MRKHVQTPYIKVQTRGVKADTVNYLTTSKTYFHRCFKTDGQKANTSGKNKVAAERDRKRQAVSVAGGASRDRAG